jgi:hypothetical protein
MRCPVTPRGVLETGILKRPLFITVKMYVYEWVSYMKQTSIGFKKKLSNN